MTKLWSNPFLRFLIVGSGLYILWYFLYEYWLKDNSAIDEWVIQNLVDLTDGTLTLLGFELWNDVNEISGNFVGIANGLPLEIGAPCDGIVLHALFTCFLVAFPGPWKHKIWFIPLGIILIHGINVLRIVSLAMIIHYRPSALDFNHDYTFTILVYAFVFLLWYWWVKKFARI